MLLFKLSFSTLIQSLFSDFCFFFPFDKMLIPHLPTAPLLLLVFTATSASAQTLPVIDLGKSVHRAQLNVGALPPPAG